jgi:hypothetical protein
MDVSGEEALATLMDHILLQLMQPPTRQPTISLTDLLGGGPLFDTTPLIIPVNYPITTYVNNTQNSNIINNYYANFPNLSRLTDVSGSPRIRPVAPTPLTLAPAPPPIPPWSERSKEPPALGLIRLLDPPPTGDTIEHLWDRDRSLTEWTEYLADVKRDTTTLTDSSNNETLLNTATLYPPGFYDKALNLFESNQRQRLLARKVWTRFTQRIWRKRTQCNVDLIDMAPVADRNALLLTDTTNRTIYRFHKQDIYNCLLSKISTADEMLPNPRPPTNPWTNQPLTFGQLIAVGQHLVSDYAAKGRCPPVLFAAFCAADYDLKRFQTENSSFLSQYAINAYFKDIHDHNRDAVIETALQLLSDAGVSHSPVAMRRFFRSSPLTDDHREWLALCRDYTLYINLHIQARSYWYDEAAIYRDVRRTYARMRPDDPAGPRIRLLRHMTNPLRTPAPQTAAMAADLVALSALMNLSGTSNLVDLSGGLALQMSNNSNFMP